LFILILAILLKINCKKLPGDPMKNRWCNFLLYTGLIASIVGLPSCEKKFKRLMAVRTTSVDTGTCIVRGEIIDLGNSIPSYGFCYSTNPDPGIHDIVDSLGLSDFVKPFQASIYTSPGTYYIRSYVSSIQGVAYGEALPFKVRPGIMEYSYDNGGDVYGWRMNPFWDGYLGNLFPVTSSGTIVSARIWFRPADDADSEFVSLAFFNSAGQQIGISPVFVPKASEWITLPDLSIPFNGNFYAMVYWNYLITPTDYLAEDQSGPEAYMDLAYYMSEKKWVRLSASSSGNRKPGVFLIRVTVNLPATNGGEITEFGPAPGPVNPRERRNSSLLISMPGDQAGLSSTPVQSGSFPSR
jgi:hypothetical protein